MSAMELFNLYVKKNIEECTPQYQVCVTALLSFVVKNPTGTLDEAARRLGATGNEMTLLKCFALLKKYGFITMNKELKTYAFNMTKMNMYHAVFSSNVRSYHEWAMNGDARCFHDGCAGYMKVAVDAKGPFYEDDGETYLKCKDCENRLQKASLETSQSLLNFFSQV